MSCQFTLFYVTGRKSAGRSSYTEVQEPAAEVSIPLTFLEIKRKEVSNVVAWHVHQIFMNLDPSQPVLVIFGGEIFQICGDILALDALAIRVPRLSSHLWGLTQLGKQRQLKEPGTIPKANKWTQQSLVSEVMTWWLGTMNSFDFKTKCFQCFQCFQCSAWSWPRQNPIARHRHSAPQKSQSKSKLVGFDAHQIIQAYIYVFSHFSHQM